MDKVLAQVMVVDVVHERLEAEHVVKVEREMYRWWM